jgi:ATP-dependent HslUV protease ATP-binding subunit HslU
MRKVRARAEDAAEDRILDVLLVRVRPMAQRQQLDPARQSFRKKLREGQLDDKDIEIDLADAARSWRSWARRHGGDDRAAARHVQPVRRRQTQDAQAQDRRGDEAADRRRGRQAGQRGRDQDQAIHNAEQNGIVFIDEIDKVASRSEARRAPRCRARACSATCCRWWRARPSRPSTARCAPTTSCSSPAARST